MLPLASRRVAPLAESLDEERSISSSTRTLGKRLSKVASPRTRRNTLAPQTPDSGMGAGVLIANDVATISSWITHFRGNLKRVLGQLSFINVADETAFQEELFGKSILKSRIRVVGLLLVYLLVNILRLSGFFKEDMSNDSTINGILLQTAVVLLLIVVNILLTWFQVSALKGQWTLVSSVLLMVVSMIISTQVGGNHLLEKWPLGAVLILLGLCLITIRIRHVHFLLITVVTNTLFVILILANPQYASVTSVGDIISSITVLVIMSVIFLTGSYNTEALLRQEFLQMLTIQLENVALKQKLHHVKKLAGNMQSPLETVVNTLRNVIAEASPDDNTMSETISGVIDLLGANLETLLKPEMLFTEHEDSIKRLIGSIILTPRDQSIVDVVSKPRPRVLVSAGSVATDIGGMKGDLKRSAVNVSRRDLFNRTASAKQLDILNMGSNVGAELKMQLNSRVWDVDFLDIETRSGGHSISILGMVLFEKNNLLQELDINFGVLTNFFLDLELRYLKVPYHNAGHGADVAYSFYQLLVNTRQIQSLQPIEIMGSIIACFAHDIAHPGVNNAFLISTKSPLALLYNDSSVLENFHIAELFRVVQTPSCNVFALLKADQYRAVRSVIIDMILATDMSKHFEILSGMRAKLAFAERVPYQEGTVNFFEKDVLIMLKYFIKLGDLSHLTKKLPLHLKWNAMLLEEFFAQGDKEISLGFNPSALMDRVECKYTMGSNQTQFIKIIVRPLFEVAVKVLKGVQPILDELEANFLYWVGYKDPPRPSINTAV